MSESKFYIELTEQMFRKKNNLENIFLPTLSPSTLKENKDKKWPTIEPIKGTALVISSKLF